MVLEIQKRFHIHPKQTYTLLYLIWYYRSCKYVWWW